VGVATARMRVLSSNSHRIPTYRRIMVVMGIAVKVVVGLVLLLPMTAYVVGSLVAAADEPQEHAPIIIEEQTKSPENPSQSPSAEPTKKTEDDDKGRGRGRGRGGDDDPGDDETPEIITPSPDDLFDDHGGDDNSGKGSGDDDDDDNSGKGSDDD
jgi:hypothetical protein